jgi:hypothetical protein
LIKFFFLGRHIAAIAYKRFTNKLAIALIKPRFLSKLSLGFILNKEILVEQKIIKKVKKIITPMLIRNFALVKMLPRSCTITLLSILTPKKMSAKEYAIKKYQLGFVRPPSLIININQRSMEMPKTARSIFIFLLNKPQLKKSQIKKRNSSRAYIFIIIITLRISFGTVKYFTDSSTNKERHA